jgi:hypothetical protein
VGLKNTPKEARKKNILFINVIISAGNISR